MPSFTNRTVASGGTPNTILDLFQFIIDAMNSLIPIIIGLAVVYFLWGLFKLFTSGENEIAHADARNIIVYSLIGIFVMTAFWGFVTVISNEFGFSMTSILIAK